MSKGVGILTTDIYLKFPDISRDEVEALQEFVNEEHIEVEGCSYIIDKNKNLQQRIDKAIEILEEFYSIPSEDDTHLLNKIDQEVLLEILRGNSNGK